jgi:hypothetical protein
MRRYDLARRILWKKLKTSVLPLIGSVKIVSECGLVPRARSTFVALYNRGELTSERLLHCLRINNAYVTVHYRNPETYVISYSLPEESLLFPPISRIAYGPPRFNKAYVASIDVTERIKKFAGPRGDFHSGVGHPAYALDLFLEVADLVGKNNRELTLVDTVGHERKFDLSDHDARIYWNHDTALSKLFANIIAENGKNKISIETIKDTDEADGHCIGQDREKEDVFGEGEAAGHDDEGVRCDSERDKEV